MDLNAKALNTILKPKIKKMGNKSKGLYSAKKLKKRRNQSRWLNKTYIRRIRRLRIKADPLRGSSQARAIVLDKSEENLNTINTLQDNSMSIATREKLKKQLSKFLNSKG